MPLNLTAFVERYPALWHVTASANLPRVERDRRLYSAAALMAAATDERWLTVRRPRDVEIRIGSDVVVLREQGPLAGGAVQFEDGWTPGRLTEEINRRVFFWPGTWEAPIPRAAGNFAGFLGRPGAVTLVIPTAAVIAAVPPDALHFTRYIAGAPRLSAGEKSPRGNRTFAPAVRFGGPLSAVREVAVLDAVPLVDCWNDIRLVGPPPSN